VDKRVAKWIADSEEKVGTLLSKLMFEPAGKGV